jgi:hypothetical protein
MFNRSEIFCKAWAAYRIARVTVFAAGDENGKRAFVRALFVRCLRRAWEDAKAEARSANAREAARLAAQLQVRIAASQRDLAARMDSQARSARIASIRDELRMLDYAPWGVRTSDRRANLSAELGILQAAASSAIPSLAA